MKRLRVIVKDQLYPVLLENTKSISDAETTLAVIGMAIRGAMMNKEREMKVSELENLETSDQFAFYNTIIAMFKDESPLDAMETLDGMNERIRGAIREENTTRKLEAIPMDFLE